VKPEEVKRAEEVDTLRPEWRTDMRCASCETKKAFLWPMADGTFRCEHRTNVPLNWSGKPRGLFG